MPSLERATSARRVGTWSLVGLVLVRVGARISVSAGGVVRSGDQAPGQLTAERHGLAVQLDRLVQVDHRRLHAVEPVGGVPGGPEEAGGDQQGHQDEPDQGPGSDPAGAGGAFEERHVDVLSAERVSGVGPVPVRAPGWAPAWGRGRG